MSGVGNCSLQRGGRKSLGQLEKRAGVPAHLRDKAGCEGCDLRVDRGMVSSETKAQLTGLCQPRSVRGKAELTPDLGAHVFRGEDDVKTGTLKGVPGAVSAKACLRPTRRPALRRREHGSGLGTEPWNLSPRCKGKGASGGPARPNTGGRRAPSRMRHRDGTTRGSDEAAVTGRDGKRAPLSRCRLAARRGRVIQFSINESTAQAEGAYVRGQTVLYFEVGGPTCVGESPRQ